MADHSITISENLVVLGGSPAELWGDAVLGTDLWGNTEDYELRIHKYIFETATLTESLSKDATIKISEVIYHSINQNLEALRDSEGYCYINNGVCDPDDRNIPDYTEDGATDPGYTEDSATDPGWSDS